MVKIEPPPRAELRYRYIDEGWSRAELCEEYRVGTSTLGQWLRDYKITRRIKGRDRLEKAAYLLFEGGFSSKEVGNLLDMSMKSAWLYKERYRKRREQHETV
jgi:transposase